MAVSADTLVRQLGDVYAIHCRRTRAHAEYAETAQEVADALKQLVKPALLRTAPMEHQERLMWAAAGERIRILHERARRLLNCVPDRDFDALLDWHRRVDLEPCRLLFPADHRAFGEQLRGIAHGRALARLQEGLRYGLH